MRIGIIGATGFIGSNVLQRLTRSGHDVIAVSRSKKKAEKLFGDKTGTFEWDGDNWEGLVPLVEKVDCIVNLAGKDISSGRWTGKKIKEIRESRIETGQLLSKAVLEAKSKPEIIVQASAIGIYGINHYGNKSEVPGDDSFLATLTAEWEDSLDPLKKTGVKVAYTRFGVVLGTSSGMLAKVTTPMKFFIGGHLGNGKQWLSWVHIDDVAGAIEYIIENKLEGSFNVTSPEPMMQKDFFNILGRVMNRPSWMHVPSFVLVMVFGKMARQTILASQRAHPDKLLESGFSFSYPDLQPALEDLLD